MIFAGLLKNLGKMILFNVIKDIGKNSTKIKSNNLDNFSEILLANLKTNIKTKKIKKEDLNVNNKNFKLLLKKLDNLKIEISKKDLPELYKKKILKKVDVIIGFIKDNFNNLKITKKQNNFQIIVKKHIKKDTIKKIQLILKELKETKETLLKQNIKLDNYIKITIILEERKTSFSSAKIIHNERKLKRNNNFNSSIISKENQIDKVLNKNNNIEIILEILKKHKRPNINLENKRIKIKDFINRITKNVEENIEKPNIEEIKILENKSNNNLKFDYIKKYLKERNNITKDVKYDSFDNIKKIFFKEDKKNDNDVFSRFSSNKFSQNLIENKFSSSKILKAKNLNITKGNFEDNIISQIKKSFHNIKIKNEVSIKLNPPELGKIHLKLTMVNNDLTAKITTETHLVKNIIVNNLSQLQEALVEKGINLSNFNVYVQGEFGEGKNSTKNQKFAKSKSNSNFKNIFNNDKNFELIGEVNNTLNLKV